MLVTHYEWTDSTGVDSTVTEYAIQRFTGSSIRGAIQGETRLTEAGKPVVWDLVLTSEDSYQWHRTDWLPCQRTGTIKRCPSAHDEEDAGDTVQGRISTAQPVNLSQLRYPYRSPIPPSLRN